jgi:hypothetical protein
MKSYRINYWEGACKYTLVMGSTCLQAVRDMCKQRWDRFTVEEIL